MECGADRLRGATMTFEGFDAALLIESASSVSPAMTELQLSDGSTLEAALYQASLLDRDAKPGKEALLERHEVIAPELSLARSPAVAQRWEPDDEAFPLRKLSPDEMVLMSGGTGSDIEVIGPGWDWDFPDSDDWGGGGGWSGDSGSDPSPDLSHDETCGSEDGAAKQIADKIKAAPAVTGRGDWILN